MRLDTSCLLFLELSTILNTAYGFVNVRHPTKLIRHSQEEIALNSIEDTIMNKDGAPLKQLQIRFRCDDVDSDDISELLFEVGTLSVSVEVETEKDVLNDQSKWVDLIKTKSWDTALLRANFPSTFNSEGLTDILVVAFPDVKFEFVVVDVENKDWVSDVQKTWLPQVIGNLTIRFPWHVRGETSDIDIYQKELVLEGGAAFGTGDHPTTRLCCRWLEREIELVKKMGETSLLDYGCGSAILGLAALKYGATRAVGVDIDKDAILSAMNNCQINNLSMDFYLADDDDEQTDEEKCIVNNILKAYQTKAFSPVTDLEEEGPVFDLVVANILAPILIHLAPTLASHLKPGGRIALSGLVLKQADAVIAKYEEFFDNVELEEVEDDWALVTGVKR